MIEEQSVMNFSAILSFFHRSFEGDDDISIAQKTSYFIFRYINDLFVLLT